jgi:hypothetical protein
MFTANRTLTALDIIFASVEQIADFDYVALGEKTLNVILTLTAIIVGVATYVSTAVLLWWEDNGESTLIAATRFIFTVVDFAGACYYAGRNIRPVANRLTAQLADGLFYALAA